MLPDPLDYEIKRFRKWDASQIETVIHTDVSFYNHFGVTYYAEFDVFQNDDNGGLRI